MTGNFPTNKSRFDQIRSSLTQLTAKSEPDLNDRRRLGREHFIPVRPSELIEELIRCSGMSVSQQHEFRSLCNRIETTLHHEFRGRLRDLQSTYAAVNPDVDTESFCEAEASPLKREILVSQLFDQFVSLLERANFRQLTVDELEEAIGQASALGVRLEVDLQQFDQLAVFARGEIAVKLARREWRNWWYRNVDLDIPMYQRLVVIFRMRPTKNDDEPVKAAYIRLFKNVPQQDIDMALPGGKVRMSLFDQGKILVPTISGVGLATFKLGLLFFAGIYGLLKIVGLIGGAIGSGWKSVNGYWKTKNRYELSLTRNLYYQNLDNNAGVLLRLSAEAERQELRETILGYFILLMANEPVSTKKLQRAAERLLDERGIEVSFEVHDALDKLQRLGLCEVSDSNRWSAVPLSTATKTIIQRNLQDALSVQ